MNLFELKYKHPKVNKYIKKICQYIRNGGSVAQLASDLNVNRSLIYRWIEKNKVPFKRIGSLENILKPKKQFDKNRKMS